MKHILSLILFLTATHVCVAQTFTEHLQKAEPGQEKITITQSKEITDLVDGTAQTAKVADEAAVKKEQTAEPDKESAPTRQIGTATHGVNYRIQAYAGGNSRQAKEQAYAIQAKIKSRFPTLPVSVHFVSPRWICQAGNCRTQEEANQLLQQIKSIGILSAIVVRRNIRR